MCSLFDISCLSPYCLPIELLWYNDDKDGSIEGKRFEGRRYSLCKLSDDDDDDKEKNCVRWNMRLVE
jgi:hypothetical protein